MARNLTVAASNLDPGPGDNPGVLGDGDKDFFHDSWEAAGGDLDSNSQCLNMPSTNDIEALLDKANMKSNWNPSQLSLLSPEMIQQLSSTADADREVRELANSNRN